MKKAHHHWLLQRVTGVLLIPLGLWLIGLLKAYGLMGVSFQDPLTVGLFIALIFVSFYHGYLGLETIIQDYIHCKNLKFFMLWGLKIFVIASGLFSLILILFLTFKNPNSQEQSLQTPVVKEWGYEVLVR